MAANALNPETADEMLIATFELGVHPGIFGIDATMIQEVVMVGELTPVRHALDYVIGIRNLRGRIITVIDLCARLSLEKGRINSDSRILIAGWKGESIGLLIGRVADAIALQVSGLEQAPPNLRGVQMQKMRGVFRRGSRLAALLDLAAVFNLDDRAGTGASIEEKRG